ncbi:hypothetical protein, partial [Agromyces humi]|uniref:hypothetical protein n=1 Tax=Agromyces humi TaxID=1766800 RepID=UPI0019395247
MDLAGLRELRLRVQGLRAPFDESAPEVVRRFAAVHHDQVPLGRAILSAAPRWSVGRWTVTAFLWSSQSDGGQRIRSGI